MYRINLVKQTLDAFKIHKRSFIPIVTGAENCSEPASRGLVLGVFADETNIVDPGLLTPAAQKYNEVIFTNLGPKSCLISFTSRLTQMVAC